MSQNHALIAEIKMEAASTRKILERVPLDKGDWKPHPKSMSLVRLASHVAEIPGWITYTMAADELDFSTLNYKPVMPTTTEELLASLDKHVNEAIATLENATPEDYDKMWSLRNGEHVHFTMPKKVVLRSFAMSHQYHHRGQLSVYLRLLDVPLPGMYGPTADDVLAAAAEKEQVII